MPKIFLVTSDGALGHALSRPLIHKLGYDLALMESMPESCSRASAGIILYEASLHRSAEEHLTVLNRYIHIYPVVALLKYSNMPFTESLLKSGVIDYLTIPCPTERIQTTIRNALALHNLKYNMESLLHAHSASVSTSRPVRYVSLTHEDGSTKRLKYLETEIILQTLELQNGCLARTAKRLGIGRTTLYRKLKHTINKSKELAIALNTAIPDSNGYQSLTQFAQEV